MAIFETLVAAGAAVALFIYGIDHLGNEIQRVAGERLRGLLAKLTSNKWAGALLGAATTAVIQSSTAATLITVGLVNSSMITFSQALGIIAGVNIGTTITAQLVAFNLVSVAPYLIILGFLMSLVGKYKFIGKAIFYFGLVFLSLTLISQEIGPLKNDPVMLDYLSKMDNPLVALGLGLALTMLFHSSSVTIGLAVLFGMDGLLGLNAAIPFVFGANLGTTSTAIFSSMRMDVFARRTAYAHLVFNLIGVIIFLPFLGQFESLVRYIGGDAGRMIANAHTIFNITSALVFLLVSERIATLLERLVKSDEKEIVFKTKYIGENGGGGKSVEEALARVRMELGYELEMVHELFSDSTRMMKDGKTGELQRALKLEQVTDFLDEKISEELANLSRRKLTERQARAISTLARVSNEIEQLADSGEDTCRIAQRMDERGVRLRPQSLAELENIENLLFQNISMLEREAKEPGQSDLGKMKRNERKAAQDIEKSYLSHIKRLQLEGGADFAGTYFTDAMATFEAANHKIVSTMNQLRTID